MKSPTSEVLSRGSMMAMMNYMETIQLFIDYGVALQEIIEREFNILPLKYLVDERVFYQDKYGKEGWFLIKGITIPARCPFCNNGASTPNFVLVGYLENKKFLGLKTEVRSCTSCPNCGSYSIYPKDLIEVILNNTQNINIINNKSIDEILMEEKNNIMLSN